MDEHERSRPTQWECEALITLAERNLWPVDELPDTVDADALRCLDERGWIEARYIVMQNQQKFRGDPAIFAPIPSEWFSPLKQPWTAGNWDKFLTMRIPGEVRVSETGKATLARLRREIAASGPGEVKAMPDASEGESEESTPTHSPDFTSVNWFGTRYAFSKGNQAQAVLVLWEAWEQGEHGMSQETVGARISSSADRFEMRKTFRRRKDGGGYEPHPAWGTMIQQDGKGCFRLARPKSD